jgi:hypothetical protein
MLIAITKGKQSNDRYTVATVTAVNGVLIDAQPIDETAELKDIRLCAADDPKAFIIVPAIGSVVYIQLSSPNEGIVVGVSEVDEVMLRGDAEGGLVKVNDLLTKLNNLENKVNTIITIFNAHTHPYVNVVTPAVTSASSTPVSGTLVPTVLADIENDKVKHG